MMENHRWIPPYAPLIVGFESIRDEAAGLQRGPVWLIEPPVDVDRDRPDPQGGASFRHRNGLGEGHLVVALVTRVDRDMKLDSILNAIAAVESLDLPRLRLVVVGDGDAMETVAGRAGQANHRLGDEVVLLTGALEDPRPAYAAADIVIGMGGSALRGLALAKPVIVVGAGSFSRTFEPDSLPYFLRNGFYGNEAGDGDASALAEQIRALLDEKRRAELGAYGMRTVHERYSLDVMAGRLEQVYAAAIAEPPTWWRRNADAGYVYGYDLAHRWVPPSLKQSIRGAVPRLRTE
jgi:glycosyltransferase involved in cell wall biosynthesis